MKTPIPQPVRDELMRKIARGQMTMAEAERELDRLEKEYTCDQ